jgi:transcriptional regulator with XRE-family HTH domain
MAYMCFELLRRRRDRGLTQAQLASLAGVGLRTVIRLERGDGEATSVSTLRRLAQAFETTPELLFPELLKSSESSPAA